MEILIYLAMIASGTLVSCIFASLPAVHIYNVASVVVIFFGYITAKFPFFIHNPMYLMSFMIALVVGYSIINTVPSIFLGAPDEASAWMVFPGQKYLMMRRGFDAAVISAIGGLGGALFLLLMFPLAPKFISILQKVFRAHMGWVLSLIIAYMVMSEFPKGGDIIGSSWARFFDAWKSLSAGILALILSGFMGMILVYKPIVPVNMSFQNLLPAFVGLFAIPWVIQNITSNTIIPKQNISDSVDIDADQITRAIGAGSLGGGFAAVFPLVTGGIGGLLAGHATAQRDEKVFMISQGVSKFVYYVGAFFLFFIPATNITRGGMAWMLSTVYIPKGQYPYYIAMASVLISAGLAFLLMIQISKLTIKLIEKVLYQHISIVTLIFLILLIYFITGLPGLLVGFAATGIGLIPVVFNSRRSNLMGVLLIPITLNMLGYGPIVAKWMGLV